MSIIMYTFSFRILFILLGCFSLVSNGGEGEILVTTNSTSTVVSKNQVFELGFFSLQNRWYVGIWYKNLAQTTYVWVANRDRPLIDSPGTFGIFGSELALQDQSGGVVWSENIAEGSERSTVVAYLLDNGNFVVRYSQENNLEYFLWQSFDFPTDTLIPGMKLGSDSRKPHAHRYLRSWTNLENPSSGEYFFNLDVRNIPTLSITLKGVTSIFRSGPWNGERFTGQLPRVFNLSQSTEESSFTFTPVSSYSILVMKDSGILILSTWNQTATTWNQIWSSDGDECSIDDYCGSNAYCDINLPSVCTCLPGFEEPPDGNMTTSGCVRKTNLVCGSNRFVKLPNMSFPNTKPMHYDWITTEEDCREFCVSNCKCLAFSLTNSLHFSTSTCVLWRDDLLNLLRRNSSDGLTLFVKLNGKDKQKRLSKLQLAFIIGGTILAVLAIPLLSFWLWRKMTATSTNTIIAMGEVTREPGSAEDSRVPQIEYTAILEATNNFSDEIGEGGFGKVFRGRLANGQQIAVKKLSKISTQGDQEFDNELSSIARLQHINIVRLLGCCDQNSEKLLVYEFLEKGSLESVLFGGDQILDWRTRYSIIKGIARGLEYMESGWRNMIIHRDLKPANILLDSELTPKISDFGLARMCVRTATESVTEHSAGTRSYMSPEYMVNGIFSAQSDIYSFGVTVLEIISGIKHKRASSNYTDVTILAWTSLVENSLSDFLDEKIRQESSLLWDEVKRSVEVSLLCVQADPNDRPRMSTVLGMLEDSNISIPHSQRPEFKVLVPQRDIASTSDSASTSSLFTISQNPGR